MNDLPGKEPFQFKEPYQRRIYEQLLRIGHGPAAFYMDARKLLDLEDHIEAAAHLIAHLFREIEGAIIDSIVDAQTAESIKAAKSQSKHRMKVHACLSMLGIPETDPLARNWFEFLKSEKYKLHKLAHRKSLLDVRPTDAKFNDFVNKFEQFLGALLQSYTNLYSVFMQRADAIGAKETISIEDAKTLRNNIPGSITFGYLIPNLSDPRFLQPLKSAGYFKIPNTSETRYLANIAGQSIEIDREILDILLSAKAGDYRVISDFANAALKMHPSVAAEIVPKTEEWLKIDYAILFPDELGRLMGKLAKDGEANAAFSLAKSLLKLVPQSKRGAIEAKSARPRWRRGENESNVSWHYREMLKRHYPPVIEAVGFEAFLFLCNLLQDAIRIEASSEERKERDDRSKFWRPAIEEHEQNLGDSIRSTLVVAIRDNALRLLEKERVSHGDLLSHLEVFQYPIFKRIVMFLLRRFPDSDKPRIEYYLGNKRYFDDRHYRHEYFWLLHDQYAQLPQTIKKRYLNWVRQGPKYKGRREVDRSHFELWQLQKLHPIGESLTGKWLRIYKDLLEKIGAPESPDFYTYHKSWWGPKSPVPAKQLGEMNIAEIFNYLRSWQPTGDEMDPSPIGLGRALEPIIAKQPAEYAERAFEFKALKPTYGRCFLDGLRTACREERAFNWRPVIEFCAWVVEQPQREKGTASELSEDDSSWDSARSSVVSLIADGCKKRENTRIPFELQEEVWACIEPITRDYSDPTPEREANYSGDFYTLAINSTRGQAMEAVMNFVLWCGRELSGESPSNGFLESIPDARAALEEHLNPKTDPSLAVRAVYGFYFPYLWYRDHSWAQSHVPTIFPSEPDLLRFRRAAWSAYIGYSNVYPEIFTLLHQVYEWAIANLDRPKEEEDNYENRQSLTAHLVQMYLGGHLTLQNEESLLRQFYRKADAELKAFVISRIGLTFYRTPDDIPSEVVLRANDLWSWRLEQAGQNPDDDQKRELIEFGWWFGGKHFELEWSLLNLQIVLKLTGGKIEPDYLVIEKLAAAFRERPAEALTCLNIMVAGGHDLWNHSEHRDSAKSMLRAGLESENAEVVRLARSVINGLLQLRHWEYRELLGNAK
jgi:hypothetical protein